MPILYDEARFNAFYRQKLADGTIVHYDRRFLGEYPSWMSIRMGMFPSAWVTAADILVVGCGFGWLIEVFLDAGVSSAVGVDSSPYIQANKATEARGDVTIIDATVGVTPSNDIKSALQGAGFQRTWDVVVDEDAASSHSDAELPAFFAGCEDMLRGNQTDRVVHLVSPARPDGSGDSAINWKTMPEWKALAPSHTWINIRTGEEQL